MVDIDLPQNFLLFSSYSVWVMPLSLELTGLGTIHLHTPQHDTISFMSLMFRGKPRHRVSSPSTVQRFIGNTRMKPANVLLVTACNVFCV